jgi:Nif11 domain
MNESEKYQSVLDFFITVLHDEALRDEFIAALDAKDNDTIARMAHEYGYYFSRESLHEGLKNIASLLGGSIPMLG